LVVKAPASSRIAVVIPLLALTVIVSIGSLTCLTWGTVFGYLLFGSGFVSALAIARVAQRVFVGRVVATETDLVSFYVLKTVSIPLSYIAGFQPGRYGRWPTIEIVYKDGASPLRFPRSASPPTTDSCGRAITDLCAHLKRHTPDGIGRDGAGD
jgi:hypothetical protein